MATCVCARGLPWKVPALTARQFAQAQFHCGNAPPAAEPRIFTCISASLQLGLMLEVISRELVEDPAVAAAVRGALQASQDDRTCNVSTI
jgi:hypothetical protein